MKKISIYQLTSNSTEARINSVIMSKLKKYYNISFTSIPNDEKERAFIKEVDIIIFDNVNTVTTADISMLHSLNENIKAIFIGEKLTEQKEIKLLNKNIDVIINAHMSDKYIVASLRTVLRGCTSKFRKNNIHKFFGIKIDVIERITTVNEKFVPMTNMEFKFIKYFIDGKEKEKKLILKEIWSADEDPTRIISQYRHRINKKIHPYKITKNNDFYKLIGRVANFV